MARKRQWVSSSYTAGNADDADPMQPALTPFHKPRAKATTAFDIDTSTGHVNLQAIRHTDHAMAVHWDGLDENRRKVASGVYFYRFIPGNSSAGEPGARTALDRVSGGKLTLLR